LSSLQFLHETNVIHRDLKPANILVQADWSVKISDFGLSRSLPQTFTDAYSVNSIKLRSKIRK